MIASDCVSTSPLDNSSAGTRICGLMATKFRLALLAAILGQMDEGHLIGQAFEIERDPHPIGGGRTEIGIELHGDAPGLNGR